MKLTIIHTPTLATIFAVGGLSGCSSSTKAPDVAGAIRTSLKQAGLKDVSVDQDRDRGVVTLNGRVVTDADRAQADSIARSMAPGEVVANQVAVVPPDDAKVTEKVNTDLDKAIENELDASLLRSDVRDEVKYKVKNGVVTLTGDVDNGAQRQEAEKMAGAINYVAQVVNEIQVKHSKATSTSF
jgi:hyperosmotically inducible protein